LQTIHYLYDFGDSWDHVIKLEKWFNDVPTDGLPLLLYCRSASHQNAQI
jgi:hypothetical protein